jgi:ABC-2 type transport system permease protein
MLANLAALFGNQSRVAKKAIREVTWAAAAVAAVFFVLAAFILIASFLFFLRAFGSLLADPVSGVLIARYVLESAFAVVFFLGVMSFIVSSFTFIFRADEIRLLASLPVEPLEIFVYRLAGATMVSGWPVFFIGVPALAALGIILAAPLEYYLFCLLLLVLFSALLAAVGALVSFIIAWFGSRLPAGWVWLGEIAAFAVVLAALLHRIMPRSLFSIFLVSTSAGARLAAERITDMFSWLPSHPFISAISAMLPFGPAGQAAGPAMLKIAGLLVITMMALLEVARRWFLPVWRQHEEGGFLARPEDSPARKPVGSFPRWFRWRYSYLFEKDLLSFLRDPEEVSRAGFLLLLLLFYILAIRALAAMNAMNGLDPRSWGVALASAAIGYFALTMGIRFVFPALSMEGKSAWVMWASPLHIHEVFSWKLFFWSATVSVPMLAVAGLTVAIFGMPFELAAFFVFAVLCSSVSLMAITLGQGSSFPDFHDRDPQMLSTSPAGLAATAIGLGYLWIVTRYVHVFARKFLAAGAVDINAGFGILIVSFGTIAIYWLLAPRRMDGLELP